MIETLKLIITIVLLLIDIIFIILIHDSTSLTQIIFAHLRRDYRD